MKLYTTAHTYDTAIDDLMPRDLGGPDGWDRPETASAAWEASFWWWAFFNGDGAFISELARKGVPAAREDVATMASMLAGHLRPAGTKGGPGAAIRLRKISRARHIKALYARARALLEGPRDTRWCAYSDTDLVSLLSDKGMNDLSKWEIDVELYRRRREREPSGHRSDSRDELAGLLARRFSRPFPGLEGETLSAARVVSALESKPLPPRTFEQLVIRA